MLNKNKIIVLSFVLIDPSISGNSSIFFLYGMVVWSNKIPSKLGGCALNWALLIVIIEQNYSYETVQGMKNGLIGWELGAEGKGDESQPFLCV